VIRLPKKINMFCRVCGSQLEIRKIKLYSFSQENGKPNKYRVWTTCPKAWFPPFTKHDGTDLFYHVGKPGALYYSDECTHVYVKLDKLEQFVAKGSRHEDS